MYKGTFGVWFVSTGSELGHIATISCVHFTPRLYSYDHGRVLLVLGLLAATLCHKRLTAATSGHKRPQAAYCSHIE